MNVMSTISPPNENAVLQIMADGRERTINDVTARIGGNATEVRRIMRALVRKGKLQSISIGSGYEHVTAWRQA